MEKIEILYTSRKGAHLITNGNKVAWIMARSIREDGTLTPTGVRALQESTKSLEDWKKEDAQRKFEKEHYEEFMHQFVNVSFEKGGIKEYSAKCWKFRTERLVRNYGKWCYEWDYLPKSQAVKVSEDATNIVLTMPRWLAKKNCLSVME